MRGCADRISEDPPLPRSTSRLLAFIAVVLLALGAAACGGGDESVAGGEQAPEEAFSAADLLARADATQWADLSDRQREQVAQTFLAVTRRDRAATDRLVAAADRRRPAPAEKMWPFLDGVAEAAGLSRQEPAPPPAVAVPGPPPPPEPSPPRRSAPERPGFTEDSIEYRLAVIDEGPIALDDPRLDDYRALLDEIGQQCSNERETIADGIVTAQRLLRDGIGLDEPVIDHLRAFRQAVWHPSRRDCTNLFPAYVALRRGQGP